MGTVHVEISQLTALIMAVSTLVGSLCGGIAAILGAINNRQVKHVRAAQERLETAVNGRVEELATAKAGQALLQAAVQQSGSVLIRAEPAQENTNVEQPADRN